MKSEECKGCMYYAPPNCSVGDDHWYPIALIERCDLVQGLKEKADVSEHA